MVPDLIIPSIPVAVVTVSSTHASASEEGLNLAIARATEVSALFANPKIFVETSVTSVTAFEAIQEAYGTNGGRGRVVLFFHPPAREYMYSTTDGSSCNCVRKLFINL